MEGRVRRRLNNVLIHLHNYTADRYRWGYIVLLLGEVGLGGWGGIGGWINLLEGCESSVAGDGNGDCLCPLISNLITDETKTWGGRVRKRFELNNILIHLHNYTADRYRWGDIVLLLG